MGPHTGLLSITGFVIVCLGHTHTWVTHTLGSYTHMGHTHRCACSFLSFALSGSLGGKAFGSLALYSRAPQQYSECVLAPPPTIRTPLAFCSYQDLNQEPSPSQLSPLQTSIPVGAVFFL